MLKGTSKQFTSKVANYIKKAIDEYTESGADIVADVNNYLTDYPNNNAGEALADLGAVTCDYSEMRELLREWYEQTPEEAARYPDFKVSITFYYQIGRAFKKALNLEKFIKWIPGCGVGRIQYRAKA